MFYWFNMILPVIPGLRLQNYIIYNYVIPFFEIILKKKENATLHFPFAI